VEKLGALGKIRHIYDPNIYKIVTGDYVNVTSLKIICIGIENVSCDLFCHI